MTTIASDLDSNEYVRSLGLMRMGIALALAGLGILWAVTTFATTVKGGDFRYAGDFWLTAAALPVGIGLIMHAVSVHRLQRGRNGRLAAIGTGLYVVCCAELVVQCMCSVAVHAELRWGPTYALSTLGTFVGLALLAAGSWRVGLLPRWMLGIWPPLGLFGSWFGVGPIPLLLGVFLVASGLMVSRRPAPVGARGIGAGLE